MKLIKVRRNVILIINRINKINKPKKEDKIVYMIMNKSW
jgi:hypothetical protein